MDDLPPANPLAEENKRLKAQLAERQQQLAQRDVQLAERDQLLTQQQATIAAVTRQRDNYYLEKLRLEVRLAKALKQIYGPRADRIDHPAQLLLDFNRQLESLPIWPDELQPQDDTPAESAPRDRSVSRRLQTRGRRDIGSLTHIPMSVLRRRRLQGLLHRGMAEQIEVGSLAGRWSPDDAEEGEVMLLTPFSDQRHGLGLGSTAGSSRGTGRGRATESSCMGKIPW